MNGTARIMRDGRAYPAVSVFSYSPDLEGFVMYSEDVLELTRYVRARAIPSAMVIYDMAYVRITRNLAEMWQNGANWAHLEQYAHILAGETNFRPIVARALAASVLSEMYACEPSWGSSGRMSSRKANAWKEHEMRLLAEAFKIDISGLAAKIN